MSPNREYVLVTGVSTGIGFDAVGYLIDQGYYVFGSVRKEEDRIRLEGKFPENFTCLIFDVRDRSQIEAAYDQVASGIGNKRLSGLINNAGLSIAGPISLIADEDFRTQMEVNFFGVRNVTNAFLPLLGTDKERSGSPGKIINISSISGLFNTPFNGSYCISKHALESLGEIYRRELLLYGIDVISILPGPIETEIWDKNIGLMDAYSNSDYADITRQADNVINNAKKSAYPAATISKLIKKILRKTRPKTTYVVIRNKWFTLLAIRLIPDRMMDRLIWNRLKKGRR